jgi:hypothetical protein
MNRNYLKEFAGDQMNVLLAAAHLTSRNRCDYCLREMSFSGLTK